MFFYIRPLLTLTIASKERFSMSWCFPHANRDNILRDFYRVIIRYGYLNKVIINNLDLFIYENIRNFIIYERGMSTTSTPIAESNFNFNSEGMISSPSSSDPFTNVLISVISSASARLLYLCKRRIKTRLCILWVKSRYVLRRCEGGAMWVGLIKRLRSRLFYGWGAI